MPMVITSKKTIKVLFLHHWRC